jgi:LuxR family maltose regulon positive regulatory protein
LKSVTSTPSPQLKFKVEPPLASAYMVMRARIVDRVFAASGIRLVLVRGPAGFGKTTVLLQLLSRYQHDGRPSAWLNVDAADNDLPRFLASLEAALNTVLKDAPAPDDKQPAGDHNRGLAILNRVAASRESFVLFLDECEHIRNSAIAAFVSQLIDTLPGGALLVVGTRGIPTIGLGRLRARGQLLEIDPEQLRFSSEEASEFFNRKRGLSLKEDQVRHLHGTTEGWIAALWLASVALERRADAEAVIAGVSGSNAAIADYLAEDVLARQEPEVQDFLLRTCLLEQLTPELCDAVCARNDSAEMLQRIERANVFLSPLDDQRSRYRYHSLFAEFLRGRLRTRKPEWIAPTCHAASNWFLSQNRPIPAISYAITGGDIEGALSLIEQEVEELLGNGRLRLLSHWLEALPPATLEARPRLRLVHAWAVLLTRGPREGLVIADAMEGQVLGAPKAEAELLALRPMLLGMNDDIEAAHTLALERLPIIDPAYGFARSMILQTLANTHMMFGRFREVCEYADQARVSQRQAASEFSFSLADSVEGALNLMQGRLRQATTLLRRAAGPGGDADESNSRNAFSGVLLAEALYDAGDTDRAEQLLGMYVPMVKQLGVPDQLIIAHAVLARISEARGDSDTALQVLTELEQIGLGLSLPRVVASARVERAFNFLKRGDSAAAKEQLNRSGDAALWNTLSSRFCIANDLINKPIGHLRLLAHSGATADAVSLAKSMFESAVHENLNRRALKLRILMAVALRRDGQSRSAIRVLEKAVLFAAEEGFVNTFIEEGPVVQGMLAELQEARDADADAPLTDELLRRITQGHRPMKLQAVVEMQAGAVDLLTRKEIQVLEMLALGYSNNAIADKLFVSESTVRTHLRNINTKLHTSNRTQALVTARGMGLIP